MKKLISMVLTAAMVVSLVPATAFAGGDVKATAKVVDALNLTKEEANRTVSKDKINGAEISGDVYNDGKGNDKVPELVLDVTASDYRTTSDSDFKMDVTLSFDNAELLSADVDEYIS